MICLHIFQVVPVAVTERGSKRSEPITPHPLQLIEPPQKKHKQLTLFVPQLTKKLSDMNTAYEGNPV